MNWSFILGFMAWIMLGNCVLAQQAELTLMTPDSGVIQVNWDYEFEWSEGRDLILKLEPPQNIEIQGILPSFGPNGNVYHIPVKDLFIKEKILIKGEGGKVLSTQTLMININDHQRGIIKADPNCPSNVHVPLFSRAILHIKCVRDGHAHRISEHGHINGAVYDNSYRLKSLAPTFSQKLGKQKLATTTIDGVMVTNEPIELSGTRSYVSLGLMALNQKRNSEGDGLVVQGEVSTDLMVKDLWISPALELSLWSMLSNTHHSPLKARRDELEVKVIHDSWTSHTTLTPSIHSKLWARSDADHYLLSFAIGGGLAYQLRTHPKVSVYFEIFPGISGREFQGATTGVRFQQKTWEFGLALNSEKYQGSEDLKSKNYGVLLNVVKGF